MSVKNPGKNRPTKKQTQEYEMLSKLLDSLKLELKEFAKKKPDESLNKLKIKMINRLLKQIKEILKREETDQFLDLLDEETIPSYSDSVMVISQYRAAMDQFKSLYHGWNGGSHDWFTSD